VTNRKLFMGAGLGAGLAYYLDPARGARRRARVRDIAAHGRKVVRRAITTASRDLAHRSHGTAAELRRRVRREPAVDQDVLVARVRSRLGRVCSHPHAIEVSATPDDVVTLAGPVLAHEVERIVSAVRHVPGVHGVIDALDAYDEPGDIPALQGGRPRHGTRVDLLQEHWAPATRVFAGAAGAALLLRAIARGDGAGALAGVIGAGLLGRATTNVPLRQLVGIDARRPVDLQKTITINAPVGEVYAFWSEYENFPKFMSRVLEVRPSTRQPRLSHWKVTGPAGAPVAFDAELTLTVPNELLAWKSVPGSLVAHTGIVRFEALNGQTRVHLRMSYNPRAGWLGHGLARAFGVDPKSSLDADLARMKTLIETGRAPHDAAARRLREGRTEGRAPGVSRL
jgi:uncharacterized membrane protein